MNFTDEKTKLDIWGEVKEDLVIFIHGGYWQGDRKSCVAPAISLVENGIAFASIGYNMGSEKFPLSELIREVIAAIQYLLDRYPHIKNITLGGHSAGAQLAYKSASIMRCPRIKRLALLAGVYQLEELVTCEIGKVIGLTFEEAKKNSCQACELRGLELSVQLLIGKKESPRLLEQNRQLISRLENEDGITTYYEEFPDLNHYSLINGLRYPSSPQTQRLLSFLGKLP
uniref:Abhydrolase_3 domain-containing protein n=1 Tax=Heterorhabditis bacteriophora TaxID=37862 RepID=A0A1I7XJN4_HETBA